MFSAYSNSGNRARTARGGLAVAAALGIATALGGCVQTKTRTVYVTDPAMAQAIANGAPPPAGTTVVETTTAAPVYLPTTTTATATSTSTSTTRAGSSDGQDPGRGDFGGAFDGGDFDGPGDPGPGKGWGG